MTAAFLPVSAASACAKMTVLLSVCAGLRKLHGPSESGARLNVIFFT
ncbi:hypothetical protein METH_09505 [Leisingera methylohalidivorans DSM 14336]|uniref:Uncharacterized protein n=1 Tax=Leisingera methylohalidivorans DSM 14336 TaxID=999552 RepID=V9W1J1_9RHOB|nr:hypothetical protein METH_09505 [Leisingera methylohalidivorans DSM 14336]